MKNFKNDFKRLNFHVYLKYIIDPTLTLYC